MKTLATRLDRLERIAYPPKLPTFIVGISDSAGNVHVFEDDEIDGPGEPPQERVYTREEWEALPGGHINIPDNNRGNLCEDSDDE